MEVQMPRRRVTPTVINRLAELPMEMFEEVWRYVLNLYTSRITFVSNAQRRNEMRAMLSPFPGLYPNYSLSQTLY